MGQDNGKFRKPRMISKPTTALGVKDCLLRKTSLCSYSKLQPNKTLKTLSRGKKLSLTSQDDLPSASKNPTKLWLNLGKKLC